MHYASKIADPLSDREGASSQVNSTSAFLADPIAVFSDVAQKVREKIVRRGGQGRAIVEGRAEGYRSWDPHVLAGDRFAEDLIFEVLREDGCGVTVISEEAGVLSFPCEGAPPDDPNGLYLVMDPLDGSILYERDVQAFWAISMGLWQGSRHLATLVMDLTSGQVWQAQPGKVWEGNIEQDPARRVNLITGTAELEHRVSAAAKLSDAYVATYLMKPHYLGPVVETFSPLFLSSKFVLPIGGALAWTYVASGRLDAYIPLNQPLTEVYSAMGVAHEAGCIITDLKGNSPRLTPDINQRYTLVCTRNQKLHDEIIQIINQGGETCR